MKRRVINLGHGRVINRVQPVVLFLFLKLPQFSDNSNLRTHQIGALMADAATTYPRLSSAGILGAKAVGKAQMVTVTVKPTISTRNKTMPAKGEIRGSATGGQARALRKK